MKLIIIIIIIFNSLTSLDSSKPIQKRISVNHEGLSQGHLQYRPGCTTLCDWLINSFSSVIKTFLQYFSVEDTHFMN